MKATELRAAVVVVTFLYMGHADAAPLTAPWRAYVIKEHKSACIEGSQKNAKNRDLPRSRIVEVCTCYANERANTHTMADMTNFLYSTVEEFKAVKRGWRYKHERAQKKCGWE